MNLRSQAPPGRPKATERPLGGQERSDVGADIWSGAAGPSRATQGPLRGPGD